ncbi:hypothetical protein FGO68_gene56 [Halteria grandinella]|uniref:Uncharacterized protein n=1 Tax=Halteria grandinella TaxID=5974 RepID=A0A8J8SUD2_HALGN|nr:hypothetical protein FGO68_gene56 [Halteria grandinella]
MYNTYSFATQNLARCKALEICEIVHRRQKWALEITFYCVNRLRNLQALAQESKNLVSGMWLLVSINTVQRTDRKNVGHMPDNKSNRQSKQIQLLPIQTVDSQLLIRF